MTVRFITSTVGRLVCLWVIDTSCLGMIAGVWVIDWLVSAWSKLLAVALVAPRLGFAAADGEHPEQTGAHGKGAGDPGETEESRHHLRSYAVNLSCGLDGSNDDGRRGGRHGGCTNEGYGSESRDDVGNA